MEIRVEGSQSEYPLSWKFANDFDNQILMDNITIIASLQCSLLGDEAFVITFKSLSIFSDSVGNKVSGNILQTRALRFNYMSPGMEAAIAGAGTTFSVVNLISFCIVLGVNMLQYYNQLIMLYRSAATSTFWEFVSLSQTLSFLPVLNCRIPQNLIVFLSQYVTVTSLTFPFYMLPSYLPNPLDYINSFITGPFNQKFDDLGYISSSFVWNYGGQLYSWFMMFLSYLFLCIIILILPKSK